MTVHPDAREFLRTLADAPPLDTQSVEQNRADLVEAIPLTGKHAELAEVYDSEIGGVRVRVYVPGRAASPSPAFIYFHGGGWTIGDLDIADTTVRDIARSSGVIGISVDYRLAPENPYPAPLDDAMTVATEVLSNRSGLDVDPTRVAVAGDSAGGNLAAVVAQQLRDHQPKIAHQVLIYPATNLSSMATSSHRDFEDGHFLTGRDLQYFYSNYAGTSDRTDPRISPALNSDLTGLPSATIITAECDPLRDEGEAYAQALSEAGVSTTSVRFRGQVHPFVYLGGLIGDANVARRLIAEQLSVNLL